MMKRQTHLQRMSFDKAYIILMDLFFASLQEKTIFVQRYLSDTISLLRIYKWQEKYLRRRESIYLYIYNIELYIE